MYSDNTLSPAEARLLESTWMSRVRRLSKSTHFSSNDLQCLSLIFHKMSNTFEWWGARTAGNKPNRLDIVGFRDAMSSLLDMCDSNTLDNLFLVFDRNGRRYIGTETWLKGMSSMCLGTKAEKSLLCWQAYDLRGEGQITRNQMAPLIRRQFADLQQDDIDGVCKEFIDLILKDTKAGKEGYLTMSEYLQIVEKRPLYREMLGQVLPNRLAMETFMATFQPPEVTKARRFLREKSE